MPGTVAEIRRERHDAGDFLPCQRPECGDVIEVAAHPRREKPRLRVGRAYGGGSDPARAARDALLTLRVAHASGIYDELWRHIIGKRKQVWIA